MKTILPLALVALLVSGCDRTPEKPETAPTGTAKVAPVKPVAFDPAFIDIAGRWRSKPGSVGKDVLLQIDIASAGGYSIDVRKVGGKVDEIVETGNGRSTIAATTLTASPAASQKGTTLTALGAWRAAVSGKSMKLTGADGRTVDLVWTQA